MATGGRSTGGTGPVVGIGERSGQTGVYGAPGTGGIAVEGVADTGKGVSGTATSGDAVYGSATSGNAVKGSATTGVGVHGAATAGYGVIAEGDATSPAKCAFRIVPQDTLPTNALVGDLCVVSTKLYVCTVSHTTTPTFAVVGDQTA